MKQTVTLKGITHTVALMTPALVFQTDEGELYTEHFSVDELRCRCKHCNKQVPNKMDAESLAKFEMIRVKLGRGFVPKSAYRCPMHEEEQKKEKPGQHTNGCAMDIPVQGGKQRIEVIKLAVHAGATGIGVANSFVHVDFRKSEEMAWKY